MFRASSAHLEEDIVLPVAAYQQAVRTLKRVTEIYAACIQLCPPEDEHVMLETFKGE